MTTWITADTHFDHEGIIAACNRPFNSTRHMNKEIIKNFHTTIKDNDSLYIVGDLCLKGSEYIPYYRKLLNQIPGNKHLIFGDHDVLTWQQYLDVGFISCHSSAKIVVDGISYILNHDPAPSCIDRDIIWVCGHVHDLFKICKNVFNAGVDVNEFMPINIIEIGRIMAKYGPHASNVINKG